MPIEIRELHIKVSVTSPEANQLSSNLTSTGSGSAITNTAYTEIIVSACVEKVMEILKNKTER